MEIDALIEMLRDSKSGTNTKVFIVDEDGKYRNVTIEFQRVNIDGEPPFEYDDSRPNVAVVVPDAVPE